MAAFIALPLATSVLTAQPVARGRIKPLFEIFATYSRPPLAASARDAYAVGGDMRAGGGLGVAAGVLLFSRVEVAGFYEGATAALSGTPTSGGRIGIGRNAIGLRVEAPFARLPNNFHVLISASAFRQELERITIPIPVAGGAAAQLSIAQRALGGRLEAGVEHRGFVGTTWFATGGVTMAGAGRGCNDAACKFASGIGVAPIVTLGLRTRGW